jgi:hypothetical protein
VRMEKKNTQGTRSKGQIPYFHFCFHAVNGRTEIPKICTRHFECRHCAFDQWLDEMEMRQTARKDRIFFRNELAKAA